MLQQQLNPTLAPLPTTDPAQIAILRAAMYAALAEAFNDPTPELAVHTLDGSNAREVVHLAVALAQQGVGGVALTWAAQALHEAEARLDDENVAALLHALKIDYAQLFLGPGFPAVSPYETVHATRDGEKSAALMVSPQALDVEAAYREAGLALANAQRQPPDHFVTEMEFMYYLCTREAETLLAGDASAQNWRYCQEAFLERHLGQWCTRFCDKVAQAARHPFYVAWARFARVWIEVEKAGRD